MVNLLIFIVWTDPGEVSDLNGRLGIAEKAKVGSGLRLVERLAKRGSSPDSGAGQAPNPHLQDHHRHYARNDGEFVFKLLTSISTICL